MTEGRRAAAAAAAASGSLLPVKPDSEADGHNCSIHDWSRCRGLAFPPLCQSRDSDSSPGLPPGPALGAMTMTQMTQLHPRPPRRPQSCPAVVSLPRQCGGGTGGTGTLALPGQAQRRLGRGRRARWHSESDRQCKPQATMTAAPTTTATRRCRRRCRRRRRLRHRGGCAGPRGGCRRRRRPRATETASTALKTCMTQRIGCQCQSQ